LTPRKFFLFVNVNNSSAFGKTFVDTVRILRIPQN
jgi:hypothetical protein